MNLSRERHIGNKTKLQFRFNTDAEALPMHRPSWKRKTSSYIHIGKGPITRHEEGIIIIIISIIIVVAAVVIVFF